jgi:hypothetical protein
MLDVVAAHGRTDARVRGRAHLGRSLTVSRSWLRRHRIGRCRWLRDVTHHSDTSVALRLTTSTRNRCRRQGSCLERVGCIALSRSRGRSLSGSRMVDLSLTLLAGSDGRRSRLPSPSSVPVVPPNCRRFRASVALTANRSGEQVPADRARRAMAARNRLIVANGIAIGRPGFGVRKRRVHRLDADDEGRPDNGITGNKVGLPRSRVSIPPETGFRSQEPEYARTIRGRAPAMRRIPS